VGYGLANSFAGNLVIGLSNEFGSNGSRDVEGLTGEEREVCVNGITSGLRDVEPEAVFPRFYSCNYEEVPGRAVLVVSVVPAPLTQERSYCLANTSYFRVGMVNKALCSGQLRSKRDGGMRVQIA